MRRSFVALLFLVLVCQVSVVTEGIANEIDEDVPLTGISASLQPDLFTGRLTGSIPIEVPPGRNGMQPTLQFVYESSGGNDWVGTGWKLEIGTIERQTRWGVQYTPTTAQEQAGIVYLFRLNGMTMDLVRDATDPLLYHEKLKRRFLRIKKLSADGTAGWEITDTKGTKYKFGTGTTTRVQGTVGTLGTQIFKWCLERVEDRDGNYMTISYQDDGTTNQKYLSQIDYTGNGATTPTNQVKFYVEDRTDKPTLYTSNFAITTGKRLKTIVVNANSMVVRTYKLSYGSNSATSHSLLSGLQQFGKDATISATGDIINEASASKFPPVTLVYQADTLNFTSGGTALSNWCLGGLSFQAGELDGNGRQDLWCRTSNNQIQMARSNVDGSFTNWGIWSTHPYPAPTPADFNGDGKLDMWNRTEEWVNDGSGNLMETFYPSLSNGNGTFSFSWSIGPIFTNSMALLAPTPYGAIDAFGDGKADVWTRAYIYPSGSYLVIKNIGLNSEGGGVFSCSGTFSSADVNGDGHADVVCRVAGTVSTTLGGSFSTGPGLSNFCASGAFGTADVNGDGKQDLYCHPTDGTTKIAISTGVAFIDQGNWLTNWCTSGQFGIIDANGDGKQDLYCHPTDGTTAIALSTGFSFVDTGVWISGWCNAGTVGAGDFNGDGKADLYCFNAGTVSIARSGSGLIASDLLVSVANGLGGRTTITYTPSSYLTTTQTQLPSPVYVVTSLAVCDDWSSTTATCTGISSTTTYSYTGGYQSRGFKTVVVTSPGATDAEKTVTTTWFHQGNELNPVDTEDPGAVNGYMKGKPYRVEVRRKSDSLLYTKTETTYLADLIGTNTTAPWFNPPAKVDSLLCDGGPCKTTRVTFVAADYDAYGNVLKESHHGDISVTGDEKTVVRTFTPNTTDYLVSFPTSETIYAGLGTTTQLSRTDFLYDGTGTGCTTMTGDGASPTKGHVTKITRWLSGGTSPVSRIAYDSYGNILFSCDPNNNKTTLSYDTATVTFPLTSTNQLGHVTTTVYYGVNGEPISTATGFYGAVKSVTDPNGKVVNHEYDALGRKTKTTAPDGLMTQVTYPTLAEFGVIGTQKLTTSSSGASLPAALTSSAFFDGLGRTFKKESSGPNGTTLVTETQYDGKGQVFRTSLPYYKTTESVTNRWRTMTYDALGRVTQVTHPETLSGTPLTTKTCYAPFVTVTVDPTGARKRETKDAYGRAVTIQEYSTTTSTCDTAVGTPYATTNYTYDLLGNLTKVVDALGNRTTMRYDTLSRKLAMSDPDMSTNGTSTCGDLTALTPNATYPWYAAPCWNYEYYPTGNLKRQTDAKGQTLWFLYDGLNRRTQKDFTTQKAQGSGDVVYTYDDTVTTLNRKGRLKQVTDAATNVTFEYDAMGRISKSTKVLDGTTYVTSSVYDGLGRLKDVTYPSSPAKTVEYLYTGPVLDKVQDKAGSGTTIYATYSNYTSHGQAQTLTYGNGVVTTQTYADPAHASCIPANSFKLCTLKTQKGTNPVLQDLTYTFTADGNVDLITDPLNGNHDFGYDTLDRLTSAMGPYGAGGATATLTYAYNQIGNLTNNSQLGAYTYPTSGAGVVRPHAVTAAGANTYTYDNNGNMLTGAGRTYTWNFENKPLTTVQGGVTTTFVYDGDGGRVKKIVGAITTRYISKLYECDTNGTTTSCSRFVWANDIRVATVADNGTVHYWHGDHLGSSSVITDSTGAKVQAVSYYPFGGTRTNQSFTTPAVDVPYKFTGQELDNTGLYDYDARQYDAPLGRFISADTLVTDPLNPQDLNRYSYVRNNPLIYTDPTGLWVSYGRGGLWHHTCSCMETVEIPTVDVVGVRDPGFYSIDAISPEVWITHNETHTFADDYSSAVDSGQQSLGMAQAVPHSMDEAIYASVDNPIGHGGPVMPVGFKVPHPDPSQSKFYVPAIGGFAGAGANKVLQQLQNILKPGGKLIGEAAGKGGQELIRVVPISQREALTAELSKLGNVIDKATYNGTFREIPGLGSIGFRESKQFGPTIDINIRGLSGIEKIHFK